jgi:hypothetical protein
VLLKTFNFTSFQGIDKSGNTWLSAVDGQQLLFHGRLARESRRLRAPVRDLHVKRLVCEHKVVRLETHAHATPKVPFAAAAACACVPLWSWVSEWVGGWVGGKQSGCVCVQCERE